MVVFYQQPNYERLQVASDECTVSRKTDSLYRRKLREQSMLHVKRFTLELRIPEGTSLRGRCVRGAKPGAFGDSFEFVHFESTDAPYRRASISDSVNGSPLA